MHPFIRIAATSLLVPLLLTGLLSAPLASAQSQDAPRMAVAAVITLGDVKLGQPQRTLPAGEEFNFTVGEMGKLQVNIVGRTAPINSRASALDYTIEMEEWTPAGVEVKRATQTLRLDNGASFLVGGIRDTAGRELKISLTVQRP